jgi:hypothetical protein
MLDLHHQLHSKMKSTGCASTSRSSTRCSCSSSSACGRSDARRSTARIEWIHCHGSLHRLKMPSMPPIRSAHIYAGTCCCLKGLSLRCLGHAMTYPKRSLQRLCGIHPRQHHQHLAKRRPLRDLTRDAPLVRLCSTSSTSSDPSWCLRQPLTGRERQARGVQIATTGSL